jgi:hypothetical protein
MPSFATRFGRMYGTSCSQRFCREFGDTERQIFIHEQKSIRALRDDSSDGTWVTVDVFVPDEVIRETT